MIDIKALVPQLQKQVKFLTEDLICQAKTVEKVSAFLREHYNKAVETGKLSQTYEEWSEDYLEQVAVSWVLACVFVRFLEDNHLIDEIWIAGEGNWGTLADGHYEIYFRNNPHDSDREYLKYVFREVGKIPAARELFDDEKTPLWAVDPSGDAARKLLLFDTREIRTQPLVEIAERLAPQAQFLGDLYQDLSEHARKKYALLQTPEFVMEFILDRTLTPAISEFGLKGLRIIDPACGSGHFLLGAFDRLFALWINTAEIRGNPVVASQNAFDSIFGVDINPFAIAITRFRMLVAAVRACGINRLHQQSYAWKLNLAVGDSLLRGSRPAFGDCRERILVQQEIEFEPVLKLRTEDPKAANEILDQGFHVVVGNPPYITVKDKAQNDDYRRLYSTCHRKYSLGVPFTQRFWGMAIRQGERIKNGSEEVSNGPGFIGMITANSFMKREFGKKLIEEFFPNTDLTHVIDTAGAYIPGHGTPTVIMFGRHRKPVGLTVRAVMGIKGEPSTPDDASQGLVWQSILQQIDKANAEDNFTSTADVPRATFACHPWSIGGGGAADLMEIIEERSSATLSEIVALVGIFGMTNADEVFLADRKDFARRQVEPAYLRLLQLGDEVRDWLSGEGNFSIFPYKRDETIVPLEESLGLHRWLWPARTVLGNRATFGKGTYISEGLAWWKWHQITLDRLRTPLTIVYGEITTHNHFVLDRGNKVFNRTAPIIKLPADTTEDDHLALLGLLNSSTACFWLKQVCFPKGGDHVGTEGARVRRTSWDERYAFSSTPVASFPIPESKPLLLAKKLDRHATAMSECQPNEILNRWNSGEPLAEQLEIGRHVATGLRGDMIALQEELDWECYQHYGLLAVDFRYPGDELPQLSLGQRAFEIVMARQMQKGELQTTWFERHGSIPITEIPPHWPAAYRKLVERRIHFIETNKEIGLIEKPEYKRRWNTEPWAQQEQRALKNWLLDRLEDKRYWPSVDLQSTARLADRASSDAEFMQVAGLYRGRPDFDVAALVAELVEGESVPFLPVLRYKATGLRKRVVWERTWDLQRQEDAGKSVGEIPVPPKYATADFVKTDYWRLRGKLDVPKERWISYPHCSTENDPSLVVGWAGWNHLQQATALIGYYDARKREGWTPQRLTPLLAGLDQLLPWIHQWHPEIDKEYGETAGQSYQTVLEHDAHELGLTLEEIRNWQPPAKAKKTRKKKETEDDK